jgi:precorrin-8X/cobalt-precorrin-8 methylmutase
MTEPRIHPIEVESYRILAERVDLSGWPEPQRSVVARVIHSTADLDYALSLRVGDGAVEAAVTALEKGSPVICDAHMVRVGLTRLDAICLLDEVPTAPEGTTRSAAAFGLAADRYPDGALWVVGNAPTALFELVRLCSQGRVRPAAVVGLPVGFVGAKESKDDLWASDLRDVAITNKGEKGGTPAAAGAVNALVRIARSRRATGP